MAAKGTRYKKVLWVCVVCGHVDRVTVALKGEAVRYAGFEKRAYAPLAPGSTSAPWGFRTCPACCERRVIEGGMFKAQNSMFCKKPTTPWPGASVPGPFGFELDEEPASHAPNGLGADADDEQDLPLGSTATAASAPRDTEGGE